MLFPPFMQHLDHAGFTLIEMMVVVALIGILTAVALPSYQDYTRRARYSEVVTATSPYQTAVVECFNDTNDLSVCNAGINGVPVAFQANAGEGLVESIDVENGIITVTPRAKYGFTPDDDYILSPTIQTPTSGASYLTWSAAGGGVDKGYAKANP